MLRKFMLLSLAVFVFIEWGPLTHERHKYGIASGDPFVREIVLTFDDGPRETGMQQIIAALHSKDYDVKATFFLVGKFAQRYGQVTMLLHNAGHELANHTFTHPRLYQDPSVEHIMLQAKRCDDVLEDLGIRKTRFLRPPGGGWNTRIFNAMRRKNLKLGLWSLNTADYTGRPKQEIVNLVLGSARPGTVVLMHSGTPNTVEALPEIVRGLQKRGYTFVRLEDLDNGGRT
ncbi:MAG: polysaccharide deacetylase family protein [Synergistaceae bacterium]|nr:polysaccharide deacetylase family protein [Synergistaceae bacterium]